MSAGAASTTGECWLAPALALAGVLSVCHRSLLSGFSRLQLYPQDPLLQNFVLEHGWRWLGREPLDADFWTAPFFHPQQDTLAFSESMAGLLPLYAPWRWLGAGAHVAYAASSMTALVATFFAFHWLFSRGFELPRWAAALGAYLVAFGAPRAAELNHPQLFAHYPTAVALFALLRLLDAARPNRERTGAAALLPLALAWQAWTNFYLAGFLAVALLVALPWLAATGRSRRAVTTLPATAWASGIAAALGGLLLLRPLLAAHARAAEIVSGPSRAEVDLFLPRWSSWLNPGRFQAAEGWLERSLGVSELFPVEWAHRLGLGIATTLTVLVGLAAARRDRRCVALAGGALLLALLTLRLPGGSSLWGTLVDRFPHLGALRVVGRVALLALVPAGVALGHGLLALRARVGAATFALVVATILVEQVQLQPSFAVAPRMERWRAIASAVPADCDAFLYTPVRQGRVARRPRGERSDADHQVDAMWAALAAGVPTLNGYSSHGPPDWPFGALVAVDAADLTATRSGLLGWIDARGLGGSTVCWVRARIERMQVVGVEVERFGPDSAPGR